MPGRTFEEASDYVNLPDGSLAVAGTPAALEAEADYVNTAGMGAVPGATAAPAPRKDSIEDMLRDMRSNTAGLEEEEAARASAAAQMEAAAASAPAPKPRPRPRPRARPRQGAAKSANPFAATNPFADASDSEDGDNDVDLTKLWKK